MNPGKLRRYLTLQEPSNSKDAYAGNQVTWTTRATVWGSVEPLSDRERFFSQQLQAVTVHRIAIRYRKDIRQDWRILYGTRIFRILGIRNMEERNVELELTCEEEAA